MKPMLGCVWVIDFLEEFTEQRVGKKVKVKIKVKVKTRKRSEEATFISLVSIKF